MTKGKEPFHRHCLVSRGTQGPIETGGEVTQPANGGAPLQDMRARMIRESGLFTLDELKGRHRQAIDKLVELIPTPLFMDPIFEHPKWRSRDTEPKKSSTRRPGGCGRPRCSGAD